MSATAIFFACSKLPKSRRRAPARALPPRLAAQSCRHCRRHDRTSVISGETSGFGVCAAQPVTNNPHPRPVRVFSRRIDCRGLGYGFIGDRGSY